MCGVWCVVWCVVCGVSGVVLLTIEIPVFLDYIYLVDKGSKAPTFKAFDLKL
jgi:hypothetical protein